MLWNARIQPDGVPDGIRKMRERTLASYSTPAALVEDADDLQVDRIRQKFAGTLSNWEPPGCRMPALGGIGRNPDATKIEHPEAPRWHQARRPEPHYRLTRSRRDGCSPPKDVRNGSAQAYFALCTSHFTRSLIKRLPQPP